jgi:hypothetical protein
VRAIDFDCVSWFLSGMKTTTGPDGRFADTIGLSPDGEDLVFGSNEQFLFGTKAPGTTTYDLTGLPVGQSATIAPDATWSEIDYRSGGRVPPDGGMGEWCTGHPK